MKVMVAPAHSDHDHTRATVILWPDVDAITEFTMMIKTILQLIWA